MKTLIAAIALTIALPAAAQTAEPASPSPATPAAHSQAGQAGHHQCGEHMQADGTNMAHGDNMAHGGQAEAMDGMMDGCKAGAVDAHAGHDMSQHQH